MSKWYYGGFANNASMIVSLEEGRHWDPRPEVSSMSHERNWGDFVHNSHIRTGMIRCHRALKRDCDRRFRSDVGGPRVTMANTRKGFTKRENPSTNRDRAVVEGFSTRITRLLDYKAFSISVGSFRYLDKVDPLGQFAVEGKHCVQHALVHWNGAHNCTLSCKVEQLHRYSPCCCGHIAQG